MEMILANGNRVKVSLGEIKEFIQAMPSPLPNPYWRYSELLAEQEVMSFLAGESNKDDLLKIARYILIFTENISFAAYLFDKSEGNPNQGKEFNMPVVQQLRELYQKVSNNKQSVKDVSQTVYEMEKLCMTIGVGSL